MISKTKILFGFGNFSYCSAVSLVDSEKLALSAGSQRRRGPCHSRRGCRQAKRRTSRRGGRVPGFDSALAFICPRSSESKQCGSGVASGIRGNSNQDGRRPVAPGARSDPITPLAANQSARLPLAKTINSCQLESVGFCFRTSQAGLARKLCVLFFHVYLDAFKNYFDERRKHFMSL